MKNSLLLHKLLYTSLNKKHYISIVLILMIFFNTQAQNTRYGSGVGNGGDKNSFFGAASGRDNKTGKFNAYFGYASGRNNTAGSQNTFLGYGSGTTSVGSGNIFIGTHAGYGEKGSNKLHIHNNNVHNPLIWGDFASRLVNINGKFGIGTTNPKGDLQFANKIRNRKIVLWQDGDNDHSFYGFGVNSSTLRYQSSYHHVFYSKINNNASKEVFRINNDGKIVIGQSQLNSITNGSTTTLTVSGGITTGNVGAEKLKADKVDTETIEIGQSQLSSSTDTSNTMLTITGGVKTDKVILNIGSFPDYVFADEYPLMPIQEVADYITENKHLPNIPSEKEIIATGMDVTAISVKLVEKIEELTLYTIQQQHLINALVKRLEKLENK